MVFSLILNELDGARFAALSALRSLAGAGRFLPSLSAGTAFALGSAGVGRSRDCLPAGATFGFPLSRGINGSRAFCRGFTLRALSDFAIWLGLLSQGNRTLGRLTPARRAWERPIAMACSGDRAPCLPCRTWWISLRTNSPA